MAGWAAYTTALVATKHVTVAAIHGLDGVQWANTPTDAKAPFVITAAEAKALVAGFKDATAFRTGGLHAGGMRFIALGCDDSVLQAKKGTGGVIIAKANKTIVVGYYSAESGIQAGPCNDAVLKLRDDLKKKTF